MKRILATMLLFLSGCSAIQEYPGTGCTSETAPFVSSVAPIDDEAQMSHWLSSEEFMPTGCTADKYRYREEIQFLSHNLKIYERCVSTSQSRNNCSVEFDDLKNSQDSFVVAISGLKKCSDMKAKVVADCINAPHPTADQCNAEEQAKLARMYFYGADMPQDYNQAVKWWRKAAYRGNADAQGYLGYMYHEGKGVPRDFAAALKWFRKAADQGAAMAQVNLGKMFFKGEGVPRDEAKALKRWQKAKAQGNPDLQACIDFMYRKSAEEPRDPAETYDWYKKAADQGDEGARACLIFKRPP
jgi:hypothetical protein